MKKILEMRQRGKKGFTLVELIVVLVILAILAAILVPALLGYIDKAKKEKYLVMAESVEQAIQVTYSETYGKGHEILHCRGNIAYDSKGFPKAPTAQALYYYQKGATNDAVNANGEIVDVVKNIIELSELGEYQLTYLCFSYDHNKHQICENTTKPRVAGQSAETKMSLKNVKTNEVISLYFVDATNTWEIR